MNIFYSKKNINKFLIISIALVSEIFISAKYPWDYVFENNKGVANFKNNDFKTSEKNFDKAYEYTTNNDTIIFNKASSLYKQKRYSESQSIYLNLLKSKNLDAEIRQKTYYNLGNTMYKMAEESKHDPFYYESLKYYQKAMDINSEDKNAKENYDFVKEKIQEKLKNSIQNMMNNQQGTENKSNPNNNLQNNGNKNQQSQNDNTNQVGQNVENSAIDSFLKNMKLDELKNQNLLNRKYKFEKQNSSSQKKDW
ncbi:MAG: hypothetical protein AABZ74_12405 [Cyanobacteriota bacterium]